jgi:hypothetical protein
MAMRSRTTFKKRQKELARQEKQRDKAARRVQRKLGNPGEAGGGGLSDEEGLDLEDDLTEVGEGGEGEGEGAEGEVLEHALPSASSEPS